MTEICKKCAECCRNHPFIDLTVAEINTLELSSGLKSAAFTNEKGAGSEEYFMQFLENGNCVFLNEADGGFSCSVYEARPGVCKKYPWRAVQEDFCELSCDKVLHKKVV